MVDDETIWCWLKTPRLLVNIRTFVLVDHTCEHPHFLLFLTCHLTFPSSAFQMSCFKCCQCRHRNQATALLLRPRIFDHKFLGQCKCNPADTNLCIRDTLLVVQMQSSWQYVHSLLGGWLNYSLHCPHHQMWHYSDVCVCFCLHFKGVQLWRFLVSVPSRVSRMLESTLSTRPRPRLQH